jgi:ABC-2 type transport system ATP-binding protein
MKENQEQYWSKFSQTYDANQAYVVGNDLLKAMTATLNELSDLGEVVEFGCGTGYFTQTIVQKATHVVATDLSDDLLEMARTRLKENPNITTQKEDCMETSFPAKKFDSVFLANVIHIIENPLKAIQESHRILKDDGRLIIISFTKAQLIGNKTKAVYVIGKKISLN